MERVAGEQFDSESNIGNVCWLSASMRGKPLLQRTICTFAAFVQQIICLPSQTSTVTWLFPCCLALTELGRDLHSSVTGEQCAAVAKIPVLFKRFPFPVFINASLIKIGEAFFNG